MRELKLLPTEMPRELTAPDVGEDFIGWNSVSGLLRRHWLAVVGMVSLGVAAGAAYLMVTPKKYEDTATLLIEKEQYNLPELVTHSSTDQGQVSTEVEMLHSDRLTAQVAHELALNVSIDGGKVPRSALLRQVTLLDSTATGRWMLDRTADGGFVARNVLSGVRSGPLRVGVPAVVGPVSLTLAATAAKIEHAELDVAPLSDAANALQAEIKVGRGDRDANVIWARYRSIDPVLATAVPRTLAQDYLIRRVSAARSKVETAVQYLQQQADTLQRQLVAADQQLRDFRQREGVVSLAEEAQTAVTSGAQLRLNRGTIEAERTALQQLVTAADTASTAYRGITAFPTLIANPTVANQLHSISDLENQRTQLLLRRTPNDPDVKALDRQIQDGDRQLRGLTRTYLVGLGNQVSALDRTIASQTQSAASLPEKNMAEDQLSRRPKVLDDVYSLVETRLQEARIAQSVADPGVSIIDASTGGGIPVWPRPGLILVVAVAGGLLAGVAVAWLREGMDGSVHSRADIARATEGRVLTVVPHIHGMAALPGDIHGLLASSTDTPIGPGDSARARRRANTDNAAAGALREAYNWLETSLAFAQQDDLRVIAVTSPLAREGKTVNSCNLALSAARHGRRVLLIDADLRRGHVHDMFSLPMTPGVTDLLAGPTSLQQVIQRVPVGNHATLDVLPRGRRVTHPSGLLKSPAFRSLIEGLQQEYDLIVIDSPPVNLVADPLLIADLADGVILVARAGITDVAALTQAAAHLRSVGAPLLGVVLNDINLHRDGSYDESYRYLDQAGAYATSDA